MFERSKAYGNKGFQLDVENVGQDFKTEVRTEISQLEITVLTEVPGRVLVMEKGIQSRPGENPSKHKDKQLSF